MISGPTALFQESQASDHITFRVRHKEDKCVLAHSLARGLKSVSFLHSSRVKGPAREMVSPTPRMGTPTSINSPDNSPQANSIKVIRQEDFTVDGKWGWLTVISHRQYPKFQLWISCPHFHASLISSAHWPIVSFYFWWRKGQGNLVTSIAKNPEYLGKGHKSTCNVNSEMFTREETGWQSALMCEDIQEAFFIWPLLFGTWSIQIIK